MRKHKLRQEVDNYFRHHHTGSYRTRKHRYYVLYKVIRDLFHIECVPGKWHALTSEHLQKLVLYWKKEKYKSTTIMNYMTVIRCFLQNIGNCIPDIDNKSLGISKQKSRQRIIHIPIDIMQKFSNPIAKIIFEFQTEFGLTVGEAMSLIPDIHLQEDSIWITRNIATNSQDRVIPIRNDKQVEIIKSFKTLCKASQDLSTSYGYPYLRYAYNTQLKEIQLPPSKTYRFVYAQVMHKQLTGILSNYLVCQTIMREMGLKTRMTLWRYLNE